MQSEKRGLDAGKKRREREKTERGNERKGETDSRQEVKEETATASERELEGERETK